MCLSITIQRLDHGRDLPLPAYESTGAAGLDLRAAVETPVTLAPSAYQLIPTGIAVALPLGHEAQIRPRSGLAAKFGVSVLNSPGTVDCDYRGEIKVLLINHGADDFIVERGPRIAQMVIAPAPQATLVEATTLDGTVRGDGGFGSTGK